MASFDRSSGISGLKMIGPPTPLSVASTGSSRSQSSMGRNSERTGLKFTLVWKHPTLKRPCTNDIILNKPSLAARSLSNSSTRSASSDLSSTQSQKCAEDRELSDSALSSSSTSQRRKLRSATQSNIPGPSTVRAQVQVQGRTSHTDSITDIHRAGAPAAAPLASVQLTK